MNPPKTTHHPAIDPARPATGIRVLGRHDPIFVPLRPRARPRTRTRIALTARRWHTWASFVLPDASLAVYAARDPLGLAALGDLPLAGATTMDVPYYAFFTPAQRERSLHRTRWVHAASLDAFDDRGLACLPLVKGLHPKDIDTQLAALEDLGVHRAAYYARELLLEHRPEPIDAFLRLSHRRRIHPTLLGATRPRPIHRGPHDLVSSRHFVAARRGLRILPDGRTRPATEPFPSRRLGAWVRPHDADALAAHNLLTLRAGHATHTPLHAFAA